MHFVVFTVDEQRFAVPLSAVEKIARAVSIRTLPKAPGTILGVINVQGAILPVVSLRKRFGLPERALSVNDHLIIGRTEDRRLAMLVDSVQDIVESDGANVTLPGAILKGMDQTAGVLSLESGMVLIQDLETLLTADESKSLDRSLTSAEAPARRPAGRTGR